MRANFSCTCLQPSQFAPDKQWLLSGAIALVASFAAIEWLVGSFSHSLTLRADAGHMLSDTIALAIALCATWLARHPALRSQPIESVAALINGTSLSLVSVLIAWEAIRHIQHPPREILSLPVVATAIVGLAVNGINLRLLHRHSDRDLNLRGAALHVMADILGSIGAIVAALAVWGLGWTWADSAIGFLLAGVVGSSALPLLWDSLRRLVRPKSASPSVPTERSATLPTASLGDISQFARQLRRSEP
ncbi:cation diffusion facilitator family transporter [Synechococcus sp. PCC 7336]|uniref:cation diffusion facilitator family transporter n=1 Tax=Synechococcus sp. PCC 7336 TaxID=195250 RepID=UPI0003464606|nr:cation diffusion facilitator family transporter [Synechococcus sp. PCC 7336]